MLNVKQEDIRKVN